MKDFITLNLKDYYPSVFQAIKLLEIEMEKAKKARVKAIKVIHGYGSHGVGGQIGIEIRKYAKELERKKKIQYCLFGNNWNLQDERALKIIYECKDCYGDPDLYISNPGITILFL